jgi:HD-GYP domain-containing protein (c-di-GMP phosphodiesterase class II)
LLSRLAGARSGACAGRATAYRLGGDEFRLLDARSPGLGSHVDNVAALAAATAETMRLEEAAVREVVWAAELHDVGKAAIPMRS